jgi:enoyl-CoA hydratase/carnithine racemase
MNEAQILFATRDAAGWARINRPEHLNCINSDLLDELDLALNRLEGPSAFNPKRKPAFLGR